MHAEELSKSAVSAEVATDIAARLEAVRARIAEIEGQLPALRETEAWLQGVLATVGPEPDAGTSPQPSAAPEPVAADVAAEIAVPAPRRESKPARAAKPARAPKAPREPKAPKRRAAAKAPAVAAAPSLPARVLAFLTTRPDPQKTSEIAQEIFGAEASTVQTNLARGAAEALVKRGQAEKAKQGATVFYQAADAASGAGAASTD